MALDKYFIGDTNELDWEAIDKYIPEIKQLATCEQNPKWHSEGNAYIHTMKCLEYARANVGKYFLSIKERRIALMSVLLHDVGKLTTTFEKNGVWHAYGHEFESERFARKLLWNEGVEVREAVCYCVRFHMEIFKIFEKKNFLEEVVRLRTNNIRYVRLRADNIRYADGYLDALLFTKLCDVMGSEPQEAKQRYIDGAKIMHICLLRGIEVPPIISDIVTAVRKPWEEPKQKVIVMIGLPGSGKDTYISKNFIGDEYTVISRDDIRVELGYCKDTEKIVGTPEQEDKVTEIFNERLVQAVKDKKIPVINNLNIKKKYRDGYKEILMANGFNNLEWEYYYIEAPSLEENIRRREGQIPEKVFYDMIDKFDWPYCDEGTLKKIVISD